MRRRAPTRRSSFPSCDENHSARKRQPLTINGRKLRSRSLLGVLPSQATSSDDKYPACAERQPRHVSAGTSLPANGPEIPDHGPMATTCKAVFNLTPSYPCAGSCQGLGRPFLVEPGYFSLETCPGRKSALGALRMLSTTQEQSLTPVEASHSALAIFCPGTGVTMPGTAALPTGPMRRAPPTESQALRLSPSIPEDRVLERSTEPL